MVRLEMPTQPASPGETIIFTFQYGQIRNLKSFI